MACRFQALVVDQEPLPEGSYRSLFGGYPTPMVVDLEAPVHHLNMVSKPEASSKHQKPPVPAVTAMPGILVATATPPNSTCHIEGCVYEFAGVL